MVARWAHNPKVVGSSPAPATTKDFSFSSLESPFLFRPKSVDILAINSKNPFIFLVRYFLFLVSIGILTTCHKHDIAQSLLYRWKDQFNSRGIDGLQPQHYKVDAGIKVIIPVQTEPPIPV